MSNSRDIDAAEQLRRLVIRGIVEQKALHRCGLTSGINLASW